MENASLSRPATTLSAARLSIIATLIALLSLATLHLLSPEFSPAQRMVSEYALGDYRWLLSIMFLAWALSCITLFIAIRSYVNTWPGKIGLGFLLISATGMALASVFDVRYELHGLAALLGIPTFPIAAMLITFSLIRNTPRSSLRTALIWTANLTWITFTLMFVSIYIEIAQEGKAFGPHATIGIPNRLLVIADCAWLITTAWWAEHAPQKPSGV